MSMTLILWKAPVVDDPDEAEALLKPYYEHEDDGAFESSADVAKVADELLRRFPDPENASARLCFWSGSSSSDRNPKQAE